MSTSEVDGIGLAEAIGQIKAELATAQASPDPAGMRLPVRSVTVELKVVATRSGEAHAGFKVPLIDLELGGSGALSRERMHTITVVFDAPVDQLGNPVRVDNTNDDPGM